MGLTAKRNAKEPGYLPCLKTAFRKLHRSSPPKFSFSNSYLKQIQHRFLGVFYPRHGTPNRCKLSCWLEYSQSLFRWPISIQNALRNQHIGKIGFAHPHPSPPPPLYMRIWILSPLINSRLKNFTFFLTTARPMLQTSAVFLSVSHHLPAFFFTCKNVSTPAENSNVYGWAPLHENTVGGPSPHSKIQLFRERLSCKRGKLMRQCGKLLWVKVVVAEWLKETAQTRAFLLSHFLVAESPWTSIKQNQTLTTHNANQHCRIRFNTFVGQPLSKQPYADFNGAIPKKNVWS